MTPVQQNAVTAESVMGAHVPEALTDAYNNASLVQNCVQVSKLRMGLLAAVIAATGYYMGSEVVVNYWGMLHAFVGTWIISTGAFALNMYLERDLDALMQRTRLRPLPAGRMAPRQALTYGMIVSAAGVLYLALTTNLVSAAVGAIALGSYVGIYTPMKRISNLNTIIGAFPGALPPVIGWAAVDGRIGFGAGLLFAILFLWQLPHFLAIAWMYKEDYIKAGMPMITTLDEGGRFTARQMVIYGAAYVFMTMLPVKAAMAGHLYFWTTLLSGIIVFGLCVRWAIVRDRPTAVHVFIASLVHLPLLYVVMVIDKVG
ncbi:MAG: heme o synthase [Candidatus Sumerlaeaceae bacterium]